MKNKLLIAAAGSGKTTELINEASKAIHKSVLITTYTIANANQIRKKFIELNGSIPPNIVIQTWFSVLIQHGVKPYQDCLFEERVKGMLLVNKQSGFRYTNPKSKTPIYWGEKDFYKHYFTSDMKIYSDKLSKLVWRINEKSDGKVINRLTEIFSSIFIDECQDLAGYDLDIIKALSKKADFLFMVCDPRQVTYLTHLEAKYKKFREGLIEKFIKEKCSEVVFEIDTDTLSDSYRSNQTICDFSNKLYPNFRATNSKMNTITNHDGIFLVDTNMVNEYIERFEPVQLRWDIRERLVNRRYVVYNLGEAKGMTFDRVIIFPTQSMIDWLINNNHELTNSARAKFYVGITRARYSVAIVCDTRLDYNMEGIMAYRSE